MAVRNVYILTVREPSEERVRWGTWQASVNEQLNHVAVMILEHLHKNPNPPVVFEIFGEHSRTIRFTCPHIGPLNTIVEYARELGLDVVLGPVERPDPASEELKRRVSHLSWRYLEVRAAAPDIGDEEMQLIQAQLGKRELELTRLIQGWDDERIANRLLNTRLAVAERRILEERRTVRM